MRRTLGVVVIGVLLAGAALGGWYWWRVARFVESTDDAFVQADISAISPKIQGYVREVRVSDNERVKAGAVLVVIDDRDYVAKVDEAKANLETQQAAIAVLEKRRGWQLAMIDQAAATVTSAAAELRRADLELARQRDLRQADVASRQHLETADADERKAAAAVVRARAAETAARQQLVVLDAERQQETAKLALYKAALDLARLNLADTVIRAPVDGVVGNRGVQLGQLVKPGTLLMAIVPLPQVYIVANFKETQLGDLRRGQPARITIDAMPGKTLRGFVESFAPASGAVFSLLPPENATGNFTKIVQRVPVRIALAPDERLRDDLRPGLSAVVDVDTRAAPRLAKAAAAEQALR